MVPPYHFLTSIEVSADPPRVWDALADAETWPVWWRWLRKAEITKEGDADGLGRRVRNTVVSPLGYGLTYEGLVTRVDEPRLVEFEASGDLIGTGRFTLRGGEPSGSLLDFDWVVETPKPWMRTLAPLARPVFIWSHHRLMDDFARGLAEHLGTTLVKVENRHLPRRVSGDGQSGD